MEDKCNEDLRNGALWIVFVRNPNFVIHETGERARKHSCFFCSDYAY